MALDLDRHRLSLDDADHARFAAAQKAIAEGVTDPAFARYSLARLDIDRALEEVGLGSGSPGSGDIHADMRGRSGGGNAGSAAGAESERSGRGIAPVVEPYPGSPEHEASYRQLDPAGIFQRPLVADSPRLKELIRNGAYSKHHANYHEYELPPVVLCKLGEEGCSADRAFEALRTHAVPGGPRRSMPIEDGARNPVSFGGFAGGHIRTYVEAGTHSIINVTENDHVFRDGLVQRRIVVEGDKVVLKTFGIGNNVSEFKATANVLGAGPAFQESTDRIRAEMDPAGQKRLREGWCILAPGPSRLTP